MYLIRQFKSMLYGCIFLQVVQYFGEPAGDSEDRVESDSDCNHASDCKIG